MLILHDFHKYQKVSDIAFQRSLCRKTTSHRSSSVQHYSSHHSSHRCWLNGARTPRSPGSARHSCWADLYPKTCGREISKWEWQFLHPWTNRTFVKIYVLCCLRCSEWSSIHPFPLPLDSAIRQSNPDFFVSAKQGVDESLLKKRRTSYSNGFRKTCGDAEQTA